MSRDVTFQPEQRFGYHGEQARPPEEQAGPAPSPGETDAAANRGARSPDSGSGGVSGSGASAGDGGGAEDYDSDPQAGGGAFPTHSSTSAPDEGGDAPKHGSR